MSKIGQEGNVMALSEDKVRGGDPPMPGLCKDLYVVS